MSKRLMELRELHKRLEEVVKDLREVEDLDDDRAKPIIYQLSELMRYVERDLDELTADQGS